MTISTRSQARHPLTEPDLSSPDPGSGLLGFLRTRAWLILALPGLAFMAVVFVLGFAGLLWTSFQAATGQTTFAAYTDLFHSVAFWDAVSRTLRLSVLTVLGCLVVSLPMAYFIARSAPEKRDHYLLLIIIPWLSSIVVRSFGWQIILGDQGPINRALQAVGLTQEPITLVHNEFGILIGLIHVLAPFMMITALSAMLSIESRLEEAAALLGAGPVRIISAVVWPLSRRGVATGCILVFLMSNAVVVTPLMLGGARSATVATMMYTQLLQLYDFQRGAALAFILVVLVVPPTLLLTWWGNRGAPIRQRRG